ncbi:MAG: hypothetical protein AAF399_17830 [Bacteroidota bacterium]
MKFFLIALTLLLGLIFPASACDLCGCSTTGNGLGVLPQYQASFVGMRWQMAGFRYPAYHTQDRFQQAEVWGRFYPGRRVQLMGFVPYRWHTRQAEDGSLSHAHGLGDASVMARFSVIHSPDSVKTGFRHTLLVGGGIKAPTGAWQSHQAENLPANFQLGTGSWDALLNAQYQVRWNAWGFSPQMNLRRNYTNPIDFRYGDQLAAGITAYAWVNSPRWSWIWMPYLGWNGEWMGRDVNKEFYQTDTGGQGQYLSLGSEFFTRKLATGINCQLPVSQSYGGGEIIAQPRLMVHFSMWL